MTILLVIAAGLAVMWLSTACEEAVSADAARTAESAHAKAQPSQRVVSLERSRLHQELRRAASTTQRYGDSRGQGRDFVPFGGPVPQQGYHYLRRDLIAQDKTYAWRQPPSREAQRNQPDLLVFDRGGERLVAAQWAVPVSMHPLMPDIFSDEDAENLLLTEEQAWHIRPSKYEPAVPGSVEAVAGACHYEGGSKLYVVVDESGHRVLDTGPSGGFLSATWTAPVGVEDCPSTFAEQPLLVFHEPIWTMHAWVDLENPLGVFSAINPNVDLAPR